MSTQSRTRAKSSASRVLLTSACAYAALMAGSAHAQENPSDSTTQVSDIIVTGSRVARPDYVANSPIVSVSTEAIEDTGQVSVERALTQLPQFTGAFGQASTGSSSTTLNAGQANASLRGLGPKRTLILLDGRRMQPSSPDGSIDLNTLPDALIGNVEVITGGASTAYGSDATAGVVNFRLRNIEGLTLSTQYGVSEYGDGQQFRATATAGQRFSEGRGRAMISVDYSQREPAFQSDRSFNIMRSPQNGTATLDSGAMLFPGNAPRATVVNNLFRNIYGANPITGAATYTGQLGFNLDGTLFSHVTVGDYFVENYRDPETDTQYIAGSRKQLNFGWPNSQVVNTNERITVFSKVNYDVTDNTSVFAQATFTSYDALTYFNPTLASGAAYALSAPVTNPFLSPDARLILASRPNPTGDFTFQKAFTAAGDRLQTNTYDVYQIVMGANGVVPYRDWTWDTFASVGQTKTNNIQHGALSKSAVMNLLYDPFGGAGGSRMEYDRVTGAPVGMVNYPVLCAGGANFFGNHAFSQSCMDYMSRRTSNTNEMKQRVAEVNLQGGLFNLPAGEVRVATGLGYRYNSFQYNSDELYNIPGVGSDILGYSVLRPSGGNTSVSEIYFEALIPILKDLPMAREVNMNLGYRYSDYSSVGGVGAYKVDIDWSIIESLRLRGGYNRSVRAPSVGELYAPESSGSTGIGSPSAATPFGGDPCDVRSGYRGGFGQSAANAAKVEALCAAMGVPAGVLPTYQFGSTQVFALTGGNPNLQEETTDTYSIGAVLQSPFTSPLLSRITTSIDWYSIEVTGAVGNLPIIQTIENCFNLNGGNATYDANNYYCQVMGKRNPTTGFLFEPGQPALNLGSFKVSGVDLQVDWKFDLADIGLPASAGSLSLGTVVSYVDKFEIQNLPGGPSYNYAGSRGTAVEEGAGVAHPDWKANTTLSYSRDWLNVSLRWRHTAAMVSAEQVRNAASTTLGVGSYDVFDLNGRFTLPQDLSVRIGVANLFNKEPPQVGNFAGTFDGQNYDTLGRYYSFAVTKSF